jgi:L-seryl-tRNA(Ser) seleniumtransferase
VAEARARLAGAGEPPELEVLLDRAAGLARVLSRPHPRRVLNATGIVLHTNLGRAPLAPEVARAVAEAAAGYSDLELDLESGERGDRSAAVAEKLMLLSGAPAAHVVNNNAAAVLLALASLAAGREVVVSRGELVEIGGAFRVPEIMERAGVRLVEVGTTNRTRIEDYARAIGPATALLLKVHRSNFELRGFVAEAGLPELSALGRARGLPVLEDLGSGTLVDLRARGLPAEVFAPGRLEAGADVVCFSGDKLLGGPQAGILLGAEAPLAAMRRNPLARALRPGKLGLAALDRTLALHLEGRAEREIPVLRQILEPAPALEARARALAERAGPAARGHARVSVRPDRARVGGGSLPGLELDTWVVALEPTGGAERAAARLRRAEPPLLARIRDGLVLLDVRTLLPGEEEGVVEALRSLADGAGEARGAGPGADRRPR